MADRLEQMRVVNELKTAHRMQMSLMPKMAPDIPGLAIAGLCIPAQEVGGDFYDYFQHTDGDQTVGFTIMDVSGKSMEAAIISVMGSGLVCSEHGSGHPPGEILSNINYPMYLKTAKNIFTTGLMGVVDPKTMTFTFANAGHMDPMVIRKGTAVTLPKAARRDLPLGALKKWKYSEREVALQPGDIILAYTDGLNEATNEANELFGDDRLNEYLCAHFEQEPEALCYGLLEIIREFCGNAPQHDDITMVIIKMDANANANAT